MIEPVRWGVLGAGWLVQQATAAAIHDAPGAQLYATGARDLERALRTQPQVAYDSYLAVIEDPRVEAVYVCLANDAHIHWIEASIEAGKHVLCEKPLVLSAADAARAFALADQAGVHLVEATWTRWHPRMRRIVELAASGALGRIDQFRSSFTFQGVEEGNYRLYPQHGGGAAYDVGIYPLHALVACLPQVEQFDLLDVSKVLGGAGVDMTTEATLCWGEATRALITGSFILPPSQDLVIRGETDEIRVVDGEAFTSWRTASTLLVGDRVERFEPVDAYAVMFAAMSDRIRGGDGWVLPARDSLRVAQIVDGLQVA